MQEEEKELSLPPRLSLPPKQHMAFTIQPTHIMDSINNIADYIILKAKSEDGAASLINLKLQKLLYYVQAWSY